jgi:hypothetical protein
VSDVQTLIDSLARRLDRPVGLDDRRFRAIAYSAHHDEIDEVRRISILGRQAPEQVMRWLEQQGVTRARDVVHVPTSDRFTMVARVCYPVYFHEVLLGLLWLVDEPPLDEQDLELARGYVLDLARELYRERQQTNDERAQEAAWVRAILGGTPPDDPGIAADTLYAAVALTVSFPSEAVAPLGVDVRLTEAIDQVRRAVPPRHQMAAVDRLGAEVLLAASSTDEVVRHATALLEVATSELSDVRDARVLVGVGESVRSPRDLPDSGTHAHLAAGLAQITPGLNPLVCWNSLGVSGLIAELLGPRAPQTLIPASLRRLLDHADGTQLVSSLEMFLEHGGDVTGAAAELFVHRSSLYNRLRRVEEIADVDLRTGEARLELHLGIRLWRMSGTAADDRR